MSDKWLNRQRPGTRGRCYRLKELPFFSSKGDRHHHLHLSKLSLLSNPDPVHISQSLGKGGMLKELPFFSKGDRIIIYTKPNIDYFQIIFDPVHIRVTWKTYKELPSPWRGVVIIISTWVVKFSLIGRDIVVWNDTFHYRFISEIQFKLSLVPNNCWPCSYPSHLQKFEYLIVAIKCEYRFPQ